MNSVGSSVILVTEYYQVILFCCTDDSFSKRFVNKVAAAVHGADIITKCSIMFGKNHVSETINDSLSTSNGATQFPLQKKDVFCFITLYF